MSAMDAIGDCHMDRIECLNGEAGEGEGLPQWPLLGFDPHMLSQDVGHA